MYYYGGYQGYVKLYIKRKRLLEIPYEFNTSSITFLL